MARPLDIISIREACTLLHITRPTIYSKIKPWSNLGGQEAIRENLKKVGHGW